MLKVPDYDNLIQRTSYSDFFLYNALWNLGVICMVVLGVFLILLIMKLYQLRNSKLTQLEASLLSRESTSSINMASEGTMELNPEPTTALYKVVNFFTSLSFYLVLIGAALIDLMFFSFGHIGTSLSNDILSAFAMSCIVIVPTIIWKIKTRKPGQNITRIEAIFTGTTLTLWVAMSIFLVIVSKGVCICAFNDYYGFELIKDFTMSTQFTRRLTIDKVCPDGAVCQIYATLPELSDQSVFINVHTGVDVSNLTVVLNATDQNLTSYSSFIFNMSAVEPVGSRLVHTVAFTNLTAATRYQMTVANFNTNETIYSGFYRTVPSQSAQTIRIAMGGDVGMTERAQNLTNFLSDFEPDAIVIGGDIAYDDAMRTCYYSWDNFYRIFAKLNKKVGRIIPFILTIGNHDVGFNALAPIKVETSEENIPYFLAYNPQHFNETGGVPDLASRKSYHQHKLGSAVVLSLDSGYITPYQQQASFISKVSLQYASSVKFANYHNPIYPSCTDPTPGSNDDLVIQSGTKYWTPLFDSNKFTAAMEHHTHHHKFTYKVFNGTNSTVGVRYVGDGSWGVTEEACGSKRQPTRLDLIEFYDHEPHPNHIWLVTLNKTAINYTSIDLQGSAVFSKVEALQK